VTVYSKEVKQPMVMISW